MGDDGVPTSHSVICWKKVKEICNIGLTRGEKGVIMGLERGRGKWDVRRKGSKEMDR